MDRHEKDPRPMELQSTGGRGRTSGPIRRSVTVVTLATASLGLAAPPAAAHDLWIEPSSFHPAAGDLVWVDLRLAHSTGEAEPVRRDSRRLERFVLLGPLGETPVPGLDGREPAGWIRPPVPGRYVIALRSREAVSVLPAAAFESYLEEKGLEGVIAQRQRRGQRGEPGRERYSRALKALLTVGGPSRVSGVPAAADRPLGLRLELIARADPLRLRPGDRLPVELRFEGRPLAGAVVEARPLEKGPGTAAGPREPALRARTDPRGRAVFELPRRGAWVVTAVHMVSAPAGVPEDWQSVWTALTFFLGGN